jgi:adenosylmethionine-8-amino-7-oxononanoate aminotransferase
MLPPGSRGVHVPVPWSYRAPATLSAEDYALDCAEALRERIRAEGPDTVLAFILEPVMGFSGGADFAPACYYERVRAICDEFGVLMVYDEIMTGVGRTGRFLAAHWWPQAGPDLVVLAKGLGSGYVPLSAFLAPGHMVEAVVSGTGFHLGHTHKAQPLACAVGLAVIEQILEQDLITNATTQGMRLRIGLRNLAAQLPIIGHVRGLGLLNAIEIVADRERKTRLPLTLDPVARIQRLAREQGLLVYARRTHAGRHGDWVMVAPPLIATAGDIDAILDGLARTLGALTDELVRDGYLTAR